MLVRIDEDFGPDEPFFFSDGPYTPNLVVAEHYQKGKRIWSGNAEASLIKSISYVPQIPERKDYHILATDMRQGIPGRWQRGLDDERMPRISSFWSSQETHIVNPLVLGQRPQAPVNVETIDDFEVLLTDANINTDYITLSPTTSLMNWASSTDQICGPFRVGGNLYNAYGELCGVITEFPTQQSIRLDRPTNLVAGAELRPNPWNRKLITFENWFVNSCAGACRINFSQVIMNKFPAQFPTLADVQNKFPNNGPWTDKCPACAWELRVPNAGGNLVAPQPIHVVDGQHRLEGTQRGLSAPDPTGLRPPLPGGKYACDQSLPFTIMPEGDNGFSEDLQKKIFMEITTEGVELEPFHKLLMYFLIGSSGTIASLDTDLLGNRPIEVDLQPGEDDRTAYQLVLELIGGTPSTDVLSALVPPFRGIQGRRRASDLGFLWAVVSKYIAPMGILYPLTAAQRLSTVADFYYSLRGFNVPGIGGGPQVFNGWGRNRDNLAPSGEPYWDATPFLSAPPGVDYLGNPWIGNTNTGIISHGGGGEVSRWQRILFAGLFGDIYQLATAVPGAPTPPTRTQYMRILWGATGQPGGQFGEGLYSCDLWGPTSLWETPNANQWEWQCDIMRDQLYRTQAGGGASAIEDDLATPYATANPTIAAIIAGGGAPTINHYMSLGPCLRVDPIAPVDPAGPGGNQNYKLTPNSNLSFYMPLNCIKVYVEFFQGNQPVMIGGNLVTQTFNATVRRLQYARRSRSGNPTAGWRPQSGIQTIELRAGVNYIAGNGDLTVKITASNPNDIESSTLVLEI